MKKYLIISILTLILIALIAGGYMWWKSQRNIVKIDPVKVIAGNKFTLVVGQTAEVSSKTGTLFITLKKIVLDDRCPEDRNCYVQGESIAKISFEYQNEVEAENTISLPSQSRNLYVSDLWGIINYTSLSKLLPVDFAVANYSRNGDIKNRKKNYTLSLNNTNNWTIQIDGIMPQKPDDHRIPQNLYNVTFLVDDQDKISSNSVIR